MGRMSSYDIQSKLKDMAKVSVDKGQETKKHALCLHVCHNGPEDKDVHSIWFKQA
jgi:hypothetical protein